MAKKYAHDIILYRLDTMLEALENNPNRTQEEIDRAKGQFESLVEFKSYSKEQLSDLTERMNSLSVIRNNNITKDVTPVNEEIIDNIEETTSDKELQSLSEISPRSFKISKKAKILITAVTVASVLSIAGCTLTSFSGKNNTNKNTTQQTTETTVEKPIPTVEVKEEIKEKILPEDWAFDPNDNIEIVNRMGDFIYNAVEKGIPVKDVMTEDEIALAKDKDENLVTIEQLMDFYMVMNIEDIDPMDYARLQYYTKTKETIVDNYQYCARIFATDSLTANSDDIINYAGIINDKESSKAVQKFVNYLAEYNSSSDKKSKGEEIFDYINSNYIEKDANVYSMTANEFTYRFMFDADLISNNSIIPKDVNIILNEDGKLTCATNDKTDDGIKDKTERAEEYTSLSNAVEEKLEISREFYNQGLTDISEEEQKTGLELEKEIKEKVISMDVEFHANEKFVMSVDSKNISAKKSTGSNKNYSTFANGKNDSQEEMAKYGAKTQAEYEAAKKAEFEREAKNDPNHTIKNPNGTVVVNGPEADAEQYNSGYAAGYYDGNNKLSNNPTVSNASYKAGYKVGYEKGLSDRNKLDAELQHQQPPVSYEPVDNGTTTPISEVIVEQPYTGDPVTPSEPNPTPDDGTWEEFEPVNDSSISEEVTTIDYTSSINRLEQMKKELLDLSNMYNDEKSNIKC